MTDPSSETSDFAILDAVPDALILVDAALVVQFWNRVAELWTGFKRGAVAGRALPDVLPQINTDHYLSRIRDVIQGGPPAVFTSGIHRSFLPGDLPDGRPRLQQAIVTPTRMGASTPMALITVQDITNLEESIVRMRTAQRRLVNEIKEREEAQAALAESERRLGIATAGTGIGIWDYDPTEDRLVWDDHMHALFEVDKEDFSGTLAAWYKCIPLEDRERALDGFLHALKSEDSFSIEFSIQTKSGQKKVLAGSGVILRDNQGVPIRAVGVNYDITEKAEVERELRQSRSLMEYIIHHDMTAVAVFDRELRFLYVSERFLQDYNVKGESLVGRHYYEVFPSTPERWKDVHRKALEGGVARCEEDQFIRKSGRTEWLRWECRPWHRENGTIGGMILYTESISARKEMEQNLIQLEKTSAVGQLAAGIAHNFNNQLTGVIGYADILYRGLEDPQKKRYAENVLIAARRSAELTRQMLEYSRMQANLSGVHDIHAIIHEVVAILSHSLDSNIQIHQHLHASPSTLVCDSTQIQNALLNVAINARDAMPSGGELIFETSDEELDTFYCKSHPYVIEPGRYLKICVTDTGSGIPLKIQSKIFDPFFTTKDPDKGVGMGLASVYGNIKQHKGAVRVYSEEGHGTTITILLPYGGEDALQPHAEPEVTVVSRPAAILVVDDEGIVRSIAKDMLEEMGHTVVLCDNGKTGLAYYLEHASEIDLVLLDMVMPEMNGSEVYARMKEAHPDVKVILSSGYSMNGTMRGLLDEGVLDFIQKPFDPGEMARKVGAALQANG